MQGMSPTDEELVARTQDGDASAFDVLVRRWERRIRGAIYRIIGSDDEALDICQETFLKAYRGLGSFKQEARFSSWLYQIALNLCRDRLRRKRGKTWVSLEGLEDGTSAPQATGPTALDLVEARDLSRTVAGAVAALPEEQREVIVLKEYQGLTFLEIAEVRGLPMSTVKTRLYRGLGQLKDQLERQGVRSAPAVRPQQA